jgi:hypothetical protein
MLWAARHARDDAIRGSSGKDVRHSLIRDYRRALLCSGFGCYFAYGFVLKKVGVDALYDVAICCGDAHAIIEHEFRHWAGAIP